MGFLIRPFKWHRIWILSGIHIREIGKERYLAEQIHG
jgi:hypothetical protein